MVNQEIVIDFSPPALPDLDGEQMQVVDALDKEEHILVVGVPATGKTRLIEACTFHLLAKNIDSDEILPRAFETSARDVMQERIGAAGVKAYTYHGFGASTESRRRAFLEGGAINFDRLLDSRTEKERERTWTLGDEGQSLTAQQYLSFLSWSRFHLLVGDPYQSIFKWAGADPRLMDGFRDDFCSGKAHYLHINYRSGSEIVEYAEKVYKRGMVAARDGGLVKELTRVYPTELFKGEQLTILARYTEQLEEMRRNVLIKYKIPHTFTRFKKDGGREVVNYTEQDLIVGKVIKKRKEYLPVHLMTIHCAKGDEWNNVLILKWNMLQAREEDKHIWYVGITRPKEKLYVRSE